MVTEKRGREEGGRGVEVILVCLLAYLGSIGGSDALLGGAKAGLALGLLLFLQTINLLVEVKH